MAMPTARRQKPSGRPPEIVRCEAARVQRAVVELLVALPPLDLTSGEPWSSSHLARGNAGHISASVHGVHLLQAILPHYLEGQTVAVSPEAVADLFFGFRADNFQRLLQALLFRRFPKRTLRRFGDNVSLASSPAKPWADLSEKAPPKGGAFCPVMVARAIEDELRRRSRGSIQLVRAELERRVKLIARLIDEAYEVVQALETAERKWQQRNPALGSETPATVSGSIHALDAFSSPPCYVPSDASTPALRKLVESEPVVVVLGPPKTGKTELARAVGRSLAASRNVPAWYATASRAVATEHLLRNRPPGVLILKIEHGAEPGVGAALRVAIDAHPTDRLVVVATDEVALAVGMLEHPWPTLRHTGFAPAECEEFLFSYVDLLPEAMEGLRERMALGIVGLQRALTSPLAAKHFLRRASAADSALDVLELAANSTRFDKSFETEFAHCSDGEKAALTLLAIFGNAAAARNAVPKHWPEDRLAVALRRFRWALSEGNCDFEIHSEYRDAVIGTFRGRINEAWWRRFLSEMGSTFARACAADEEGAAHALAVFIGNDARSTVELLRAASRWTTSELSRTAAEYSAAGEPTPDWEGVPRSGVFNGLATWTASACSQEGMREAPPELILASVARTSLLAGEIDVGLAVWGLLGSVGAPLASVLSTSDAVFRFYLPHVWRATRAIRRPVSPIWSASRAAIYLARTQDGTSLLPVVTDRNGRVRLIGLPLVWSGGDTWYEGSSVAAVTAYFHQTVRQIDAGMPVGAWALRVAGTVAFMTGDHGLAMGPAILHGYAFESTTGEGTRPPAYTVDDASGGIWCVTTDGELLYQRPRFDPCANVVDVGVEIEQVVDVCRPTLRVVTENDWAELLRLGDRSGLRVPPTWTAARRYRVRPAPLQADELFCHFPPKAPFSSATGAWIGERADWINARASYSGR